MARTATKDPLEKFRFGVTWDDDASAGIQEIGGEAVNLNPLSNKVKAGFHDIQMPKRTTNKVMYREGTDPDVSSVSAGLSTMEDIVMSRGLVATGADFKDLSAWAALVHSANDTDSKLDYTLDRERPATGNQYYRKHVTIYMYDRAGSVVRAWKLFNAFPVSFVAGSDLNAAEDGEKSLEQVTLAYEDFMEVETDGAAATSDPLLP